MSKLDDIDYLTGLIYEHLYQKISSRPIESKPLSTNYLEDLTIVKKMYTGSQLKELINMIFNTNLSYLGRGESAFKFKRVDNPSTDILLRQYNKEQDLNPSNSLNVDKIVAYLLSDLVIHKKTSGIMINICNADIPVKDLDVFIKKYPEIKFSNSNPISVTIREHFYKLVSLKDFLNKDLSVQNFKSSIFQVLHTLDVIQSMYPTFRHNNLTISTTMVYETNEKSLNFKVGSKEFTIKSNGETKITNFLNSNMKDYIMNDSLEPKMQEPNKIFDVEMFLDSLMELELPKEIKEFVKRNSDKTARDILLNDPLFNQTIQLGGKKKKSKRSRRYAMTQEQVDKILGMELEEEKEEKVPPTLGLTENTQPEQEQIPNTLGLTENTQPTHVELPVPIRNFNVSQNIEKPLAENMGQSLSKGLDPVKQIMKDFASKPVQLELSNEASMKFPSKPVNIPGTNMQLKEQSYTNPIIQVNVPAPPPLEPNSLSSLLGNPERHSNGIMQEFAPSRGNQILTFNANPQEVKPQEALLQNKNGNVGVTLVGGKSKKNKKSSRVTMSQEEFELIMLSSEKTPVEETVQSLKPKKTNPIEHITAQPTQPTNNINSLLGQQLKPTQPTNNINSLLGQQPSNNEEFGSNSISSHLKKINPNNSSTFDAPLNVIPNPYKQIDMNSHSILGLPEQGQRGGAPLIVPRYRGNKNSPYISNDTKRIQKETYYEQNPDAKYDDKKKDYSEQNPKLPLDMSKSVFELKIAPELLPQPPLPVYPKAQPDQIVKNYILPPPPGQPINQTYSIPNQIQAGATANVISQNTYNISMANPGKINEFREDILPSKDESMTKYTMNTISERLIIYNYLRSILIRQNDGENINFISDKSPEVRNLLSYLRILDLQVNKNTGNLPKRLVMYNSCYPIRVDRANYNVGCAKNNIGINIRIYQLIMGETFVNKYKSLPYKVFEVWREISIFEQMRDNIIKSNLSPNFGILYAYYLTKDVEIDFLKINRLRNKEIVSKQEKEQKRMLNNSYKKEMEEYLVSLQKYSTKDLTKMVEDVNIHTPSDKCLIALTESGTHDLITWASRQYEDNGMAKKMINTGYHSAEVWQSILFQMYQGFLCMYKLGMSFETFDLNSNVMIKSLKTDEMNKGYWKYRINGIEFYIPNYGYMVLINPDFADIKSNDEQTLNNFREDIPSLLEDNTHKVLGDDDMKQLDNLIYKSYSNELLINQTEFNLYRNKIRTIKNMSVAFNPNMYNSQYILNGGIKPDNSVITTIQNINKNIKTETEIQENLIPDEIQTKIINISEKLLSTLISNFKGFLHNRVGPSLKEGEVSNIIESDSLMMGELVVCLDNKRWGIITKQYEDGSFDVYTVDEPAGMDNNIQAKLKPIIYNIGDLRRSSVIVEQISKPNQKLGDNDLLETYDLSI